VHRAAVPDDYESTGQISQHRLDEGGHVPVVEVAAGQRVEIEAQVIPAGRQPSRRGDRDLLAMPSALGERRRMALERPRAAAAAPSASRSRRSGRCAPPALAPFLMRGRSDSSQAAIASVSRSRLTRTIGRIQVTVRRTVDRSKQASRWLSDRSVGSFQSDMGSFDRRNSLTE
jgi:hypothetical protein